MKRTKTHEVAAIPAQEAIPATTTQIPDEPGCDLCGKPIEPPPSGYDV